MRKQLLGMALAALIGFVSHAQDEYADKVKTIDSTLETLYAVISGEAGERRNWELFKYLFIGDAQLIPSGPNEDGEITYEVLSPQGYVERSSAWLEENGFFEKEIYRVTEAFGSVTHVFSTYESFRSAADEEPFARGINSIQLMNDGDRWWVVSIYWTAERDDNPIPEKYLPK